MTAPAVLRLSMRYLHICALVGAGYAYGAEPDRLSSTTLAAAFGAPPLVRGLQLSPDGTRVSYLEADKDGELLRVLDTRSDDVVTALARKADDYDITWCRWANDERLLCSLRVREPLNSHKMAWQRLLAVNADGSNPLLFRTREDSVENVRYADQVIDWLRDDPQHVLLGMRIDPVTVLHGRTILKGVYVGWRSGMPLVRLNIYDGLRSMEPGVGRAHTWFTDGHGAARLGVTFANQRHSLSNVTYRVWWARYDDTLTSFQAVDLKERADAFSPVSFDRDANEALYFDRHEGRTALFAMDPRQKSTVRLVYAHRDVDVAGVHRLGKHQRVVAASYVADRPRLQFFDPKIEQLRVTLSAEFPGLTVDVVDEDWSERMYVLFVHGDRDPGTYYLFDREAQALETFGQAYPALGKRGLVATKLVTYAGADGKEVNAYLTLPNDRRADAAVVLARGGPVAPDYWELDFVAQYLAAKGYAVLRSYRGSSADFADWLRMRTDVSDAARYLIDSGIAAGGRVCVVGWGDGGYAALSSAAEHRGQYRCVVGIGTVTTPETVVPHVMDSYDASERRAPAAELTGKTGLPTLLFHGHIDLYSPFEQIERLVTRMRESFEDVTLIEYEQAGNDIRPGRYRIDMLSRLGAFIDANLGHEPGHFYSRPVVDTEPVDVVDFGTDAHDVDGYCNDRRFTFLGGRRLRGPAGRPSSTRLDATDCRRLFMRGELALEEDVAVNRSGSVSAHDRVTFFLAPSEQNDAAIVEFDDYATGPAGVAVVYTLPGYHTFAVRHYTPAVRLSGPEYSCTVDLERDEHSTDPSRVDYRAVAARDEGSKARSMAHIAAYAGHHYKIQTAIAEGVLTLRVTDVSEGRIVLDQRESLASGCTEAE